MRAAGPLSGVRVTDLSRVLAGPYATMLLADMGADVIKIEQPGTGDETRAWGPPHAGGEAAYYLALNRGKRSLAVDLKDPRTQELVRELCVRSDVVVQNFRPGVADRLGLGATRLRAANPALVYCSVSGFGARREPADRPGFDAVIQAESGLMSVTGDEPTKVGVAITDVLAALNAAVGILGALYRRTMTGRGDHVEVSLLDSALSGMVNLAQTAIVSGEEPARHGNAHPSIVPYQAFRTRDGQIMVAAGNDTLFRSLCAALDLPALAEDPRYSSNRSRVAHRDSLVPIIQSRLSTQDSKWWVDVLLERGIPVGEIRGVRDALAAAARAGDPATFTVQHPTAGPLDLVRPGFSVSGQSFGSPPPLLGEHSAEILTELGLSPDRIAALSGAGLIGTQEKS
ncbi:CaiB/BaiF CoA transferase family protein [Allokutzneria albata]|uniref:CoA:oxalate CoA-transferase n=1 Tax=Allokutzneria albata TaxID=211114 RepID=A0A1H0DCW7_ALLAB|nr:CaiB/BaiF CoA-transferase family protein [Allokutzneria albata]SDN67964.1 CoA:oxalate CoA-transferase [Allokutzneria albata]